MQMSDEFPEVDVVGVDLAPIQPEYVVCTFLFSKTNVKPRRSEWSLQIASE